MTRHSAISALVTLCLLLIFVSCRVREVPTSVTVSTGPSFLLHGSGRLATFTIFAPPKGQKIASGLNTLMMHPDPEGAPVVWQIKVSKGYFEGARVEGLRLVYGVVPDGYTQTAPVGSQSAVSPPNSGVIYAFFAETTGAGGIGGFFYEDRARGAKAVEIPNLCQTWNGEHYSRVDCNTNKPYEEPADIESFVLNHQVKR